MMFDTKSEDLFAAICRRHHYSVSKLDTRAEQQKKTADFSVETPFGRFLAEVEELTPNADDLRQIRELKETGMTSGGGTIGSRARRAIRHAAVQLRDHCDDCIPMIAVLYDNVQTPDGRVSYPMFYLEPHHIDAAMYGDRVVNVSLRKGTRTRPDRSGGKRTTTIDRRNYLSAVVVISDWDDETLIVYHNRFAHLPLPKGVFSDSKCHHYEKGDDPHAEPWKWHERANAEQAAPLQPLPAVQFR